MDKKTLDQKIEEVKNSDKRILQTEIQSIVQKKQQEFDQKEK